MRNLLYFILLIILVMTACEKDDICVEGNTPRLIIKFKSQADDTAFPVNDLTVWPAGRDSIYSAASLDSILIPLDVNATSTLYKFASGSTIDEVTIAYDVNEIYIGRSCGFIANFQNLNIPEFGSAWISNVQVDNATIENEETTHITIYH